MTLRVRPSRCVRLRQMHDSTVAPLYSVVCAVLSAVMAAYAFARLASPERGILSGVVLATVLMPIALMKPPFNDFTRLPALVGRR